MRFLTPPPAYDLTYDDVFMVPSRSPVASFSAAPLRVATWVGLSAAVLAFLYGIWVLIKVLFWGDPVRGYPTLMVVILFLGGIQLLALGIIGEYVGRTYAETKRRPLYYVESRQGGEPPFT